MRSPGFAQAGKASADNEFHQTRRPAALARQRGESFSVGGPSGKPGPAKLAKLRFQRAPLAALEEAPEALALSKPENGFAAMARQMALDAAAGRGAAQRLVLSRLDAECEREDQLATERNEADAFSLVQGESEGGGEDSAEAVLQTERYPSPATAQVSSAVPANLSHKGRGEIRRMARTDYGATIERNEADPFSLVQGESQGGREDSAEAVRPMERYNSPATAQVSLVVPASGGQRWRYGPHKGKGGIRRMARTDCGATTERNEADLSSLVQGESQGSGEDLAEKICVAVAASSTPSAAPVHSAMRAQLMMGTAAMASASVFPARLNRQSASGHSLVERAACSSRIDSG
jgi:hypothetical protein